MRRALCFQVLLIVVFGVTFVSSAQVWSLESFASAGAGMPPFGIETVALSGSGSGSDMLQFKAGSHLLGFQPRKVYFASLDHALSVEFLGTAGVMPQAGWRRRGAGQ